jgi:hypothetical protein
MTKTQTIDFPDFNQQLTQMLEEHIAACRAAMFAAAERAFPANLFSPPKTKSPTRRPGKRASRTGQSPRLVKPLARRTPAEMAAVVERLYQAVCAKPGESKATLAAQIGVSARELDRPMNQLKNDGKVRTVGQRHFMRYFPLMGEAAQAR